MSSLVRRIYSSSLQDLYRNLADKKQLSRARKLFNEYIANTTVNPKKLHIGCGGNFFQNWLNCDLVPNDLRIAKLDAGKPFPLESESFDYVYSEHLIEHLTFEQQQNFLAESLRVLKPGGKIRIATPDFDFLIKLTTENKTQFERDYLNWNARTFLSGIPEKVLTEKNRHVYVINNYLRDWGHQLVHNKSTLKCLVEHIGFHNAASLAVSESSDPELTNLEQHGRMITDEYNRFETMIIEAQKRRNV